MLRPDADPGEVFAVGGAFAGLAAEYFQRRGVEGRSVRNAEYVVGGDHYMQSYQKKRTIPKPNRVRFGKAPLRCKRKNNNPRSGYIRPAVVVFAFMPSAFALPSPCRYFLTLGASIMFIFLPSSFGIISTLANSSRSVAKRSSRISPCSLKTIERPRKKT